MLLARLGRIEAHGVCDPRPGQAGAACGEQHSGFQAIDLGPSGGKQRQGAGDRVGGELSGSPERVVDEVDRRGWCGCGPPGAGRYVARPDRQEMAGRLVFPLRVRVIPARRVRTIALAFHAVSLHNQQNVVNILLKGRRVIHQLRDAVPQACGGKAGVLGALVRAGLRVPDGFVIPFDVYRAARADLTPTVADALRDAIAAGLAGLGDPPVAVRSSANVEDGPAASAAGQHESVLAVRGAGSVLSAMETCWASLRSQRATAYRAALGAHEGGSGPAAMAVLVQRLVDAEVSGVMFTPAGRRGSTEIEASWGLGLTVVGGAVTPDAYRVDGSGAVTQSLSDKRIRMDRDGAALVTRPVPDTDRGAATIDDETAVRLSRLGRRIAAVLGGPQDVEWAIEGGRIWILQARPITAAFPAPLPDETAIHAGSGSPATLTGTPGSHGTVTGTARIVRGPGDFARVCPGDILICPYTDPAWTPLLRMAKGVVTETGGVLSHAAIVAREMRIPAVLAVAGVTDLIRDDTAVTIDGSVGTVTAVRA